MSGKHILATQNRNSPVHPRRGESLEEGQRKGGGERRVKISNLSKTTGRDSGNGSSRLVTFSRGLTVLNEGKEGEASLLISTVFSLSLRNIKNGTLPARASRPII